MSLSFISRDLSMIQQLTPGIVLLIHHYFSTGDGSIRSKFLTKAHIINGIIQVLHIQVDALITIDTLDLPLLKLRLQIHLSFSSFLCSSCIKLLSIPVFSIEFINTLQIVKNGCLTIHSHYMKSLHCSQAANTGTAKGVDDPMH